MKRLFVAAAAIAAAAGVVAAHPAIADDPRDSASLAKFVNPILGAVPSPPGWHQRSLCFGDEHMGKAWCLYFPFPM